MAKVELIPAVTRTEIVTVNEEEIVLTLRREEAEVLRAVTGLIGGLPPDAQEVLANIWSQLTTVVDLPSRYVSFIIQARSNG